MNPNPNPNPHGTGVPGGDSHQPRVDGQPEVLPLHVRPAPPLNCKTPALRPPAAPSARASTPAPCAPPSHPARATQVADDPDPPGRGAAAERSGGPAVAASRRGAAGRQEAQEGQERERRAEHERGWRPPLLGRPARTHAQPHAHVRRACISTCARFRMQARQAGIRLQHPARRAARRDTRSHRARPTRPPRPCLHTPTAPSVRAGTLEAARVPALRHNSRLCRWPRALRFLGKVVYKIYRLSVFVRHPNDPRRGRDIPRRAGDIPEPVGDAPRHRPGMSPLVGGQAAEVVDQLVCRESSVKGRQSARWAAIGPISGCGGCKQGSKKSFITFLYISVS